MDASTARTALRDRLGTKHGIRVVGSRKALNRSGVEVVASPRVGGLAVEVWYRGEHVTTLPRSDRFGRALVASVYAAVAGYLNRPA